MKNKIIFSLGILTLSFTSYSQETDNTLKKANKLYDDYSYIKSIEVYEKVAKRGYKSVELFEKLGNSYFFNSQFKEANKWYTELFNLNENIEPIYYYRYSQTLKAIGNLPKSNHYLSEFTKLSGNDTRAQQFSKNKNYLAEIEKNSNRFEIQDAGINSEFSDYGVSINKDTLVFTSTRIPESGKKKKDYWTDDYFSSLYSATLNMDGSVDNLRYFPKEIQTIFHESTPAFSKDGKTMYFTRNNYLDNKKRTSSEKVILLKIYKAILINGKWSSIKELSFNSDEYSCAHPTLSPDGRTMYFVSNMPNGFGDSDIYKVNLLENGEVSKPENLGGIINTPGKESFPFINKKNELYFSSDGHLGLGGLDVFVSKLYKNNFLEPVNVGRPINSAFDDFGYVKLDMSKNGFFTSNREGGVGKDDIYKFKETKELEFNTTLEGVVVDNETNLPIPNANVTIYDKKHEPIATVVADENGRFATVVEGPKDGNYYIKSESPDFDTQEKTVDSNKEDLRKIVVKLPKGKSKLSKGSDLAKMLNIKDILFDLDKFNIRKDAEVELQKILQVMTEYTEIKVVINSHTDSRASHVYNQKLSERRAKASMEYLVSKGIARERLSAQGFGETKLLNECSDGIKCEEEQHQLNRRSEFVIVE